GAAKSHYCMAPQEKTAQGIEKSVKESLDGVSLLQIQWFVNQATCFITTYRDGLSGAQAAWANKKYHGHHMLLPQSILEAMDAVYYTACKAEFSNQ
ncbi:hypothetical protein EDB92DRAFT_1804664, partial [Lactarius akahatsu]